MSVNNNADDYANARIGIYFPGFPAYLTGQCTSLLKWFLGEMCGIGNWQDARGNAKDFGTALVNQGLATQIDASQRRRGDLVIWPSDGGGKGHGGILLSGDRVFEENVGLKGLPSQVVEGNRVYPSRTDPLNSTWRVGAPVFYRIHGYTETAPAVPVPPAPAPAAKWATVKSNCNVRAAANSTSAISSVLTPGARFQYDGILQGQNINGNAIWVHSTLGHYVWSGNLVL